MTQPVQSDGVGVLIAREAAGTPATQPTTGWMQLQVNPGGIQGFTRTLVTAEHDPLSPNMTPERDQVVGYTTSPKLTIDLTMDALLYFREPIFRSSIKHSGGKGVSLYRPTAVTATGYTVAANGDLADGVLVWAAGFSTAANNGLKKLAGTSIATEIKTAGLTAEASPPSNATVRIAGVEGATSDLALDASGNLTSGGGAGPHIDFTTLGLNAGQRIKIGDAASGAGYAFGTAGYNDEATIVTVAAAKLTLKWRKWTVGAADAGTGKTIRVLFESWIRNVPITHTDYLVAPTSSLELSEPGAESGPAPSYTYFRGQAPDSFDLDIPVQGKVTATINLVGMKADTPTSSQAAGCSTAYAPLAATIFATDSHVADIRIIKQADESSLSAEFNSCKLTLKDNVKPRNQIGTDGAAGLNFGEYTPGGSVQAYLINNDLRRAIDANTDCVFLATCKSEDGGFAIDYPMCKIRKGDKTYQRAESVMMDIDLMPKRDPTTGFIYTMSTFSYLPAAS